MVDVMRMPDTSFGTVPTPAIVAPIEFSMRLADYRALGGHMGFVRPMTQVLAQRRVAQRRRADRAALRAFDRGEPVAARPAAVARLSSDGEPNDARCLAIAGTCARADRHRDRRRWRRRRQSRPRTRRPGGASSRCSTELVAELPLLRTPVQRADAAAWRDRTAACGGACVPFSSSYITPMAAVAGAVAQELIACYQRARACGARGSTTAATSRCI